MKREVIAAQGEVKVFKIAKLPAGMTTKPVEKDTKGNFIISHSESGHHHVIGGADVLERTNDVPAGLAILYAIVKDPTSLKQDAPTPHKEIPLDANSIYELRISREFDPFAEQARRVAD
jgi:hypothetical protein